MKESTIIKLSDIISKSGLTFFANIANRNFLRIIIMHYVREKDLDNLKVIIDYIKNKFRIISPDEFLDIYGNGKELKGRNILLTFDDGLYSSYRAAREVLDPLGLKAIFFIPTKIFELSSLDDMYIFAKANIYSSSIKTEETELFKTMSAEDAGTLARNGHFVCSHTHNHVYLRDIKSTHDVAVELESPKGIIENSTGFRSEIFSYPKGNYKVASAFSYNAIRNHYKYCFTGIGGKNTKETDRYYIKRDCIHSYYSLKYAKQILNGVFDIPNFIKHRKLIKKTQS